MAPSGGFVGIEGGEVVNMSKRFTLNKDDVLRIAKNALIFAGPALLVLVADLVKALPTWLEGYWLVVALYALNVIADTLRKFLSGK